MPSVIPLTLLILGQLKFLDADLFPMKKFFDSDRAYSHLCRYGGNICCDCSDDCMKYKTCCIDKLWDDEKKDHLQTYLKLFLSESQKYKNMSCEPALTVNKTHPVKSYFMVKSCLPNTTGDDVERCLKSSLHIKDDIPVLGNDTYLYRNLHCAKCNLVFDYKFIDIKAKCENASNLMLRKTISKEELNKLSKCEFSLDTSDHFQQGYIRACERKQNVCPQTDPFYNLCNAYGKTMGEYKNYHCAMCAANQNLEVIVINKTVVQPTHFHNGTHNVTTLKNVTIQEAYPVTLPMPDIDFTCSAAPCKFRHCYMPNGEDSTKFESTFSIGALEENKGEIKYLKQKFPIRQFMNISKAYDFGFNKGLEQYLCNAPREKCCDCSDDCMVRKRCCIDKFWNETHPVNLNSYINQFIQTSQEYKDYFCEPILPMAYSFGYQTEYRLMVKSCLPKASVDNVKKCLHGFTGGLLHSNLPVKGFNGYIYRNSFCAKCNFITKYQPISVKADCNVKNPQTFYKMLYNTSLGLDIESSFKECEFSLANSRYYKSKKCNPMDYLKGDCPRSNIHYELCHVYSGKVAGFQNYHCWLCNQNNHTSTFPPIDYCDDFCFGPTSCSRGPDPTWSLLLNFNTNQFQIANQKSRSICKNGSKYDTGTLKCEKVICPPDFVFDGKDCLPKPKKPIPETHVLKPTFDKCFSSNVTLYMVLKKVISSSKIKILRNFPPYMYDKFTTYSVINQTNDDQFVIILSNFLLPPWSDVNQNIYKFFKSLEVGYNYNLWHNIEKILITKGRKLKYTEHYQLEMSRYFPKYRICAEANIRNGTDGSFTRSCMVTKGNETFSKQNISMWIEISKKSSSKWYSTCQKYHLHSNCPRRKISGHISFSEEGNLLHKRLGQVDTYNVSEYIPLSKGYGVCIRSSFTGYGVKGNHLETVYVIEHYISLTGTIISVSFYIFVILSFLLFKELRTVPGLNTLGMCISLFFAEVIFLLAINSNFSGTACKIVAATLHWCLLSSFMWNMIIAFDLISKFSSFTVASRGNNNKKFIRRCIYSLIPPTSIVSLSVILAAKTTVVGYGTSGFCWITGFYARVGFYIIPVAVIFLTALSTLLYTVRKIHSEFKVNEEILKTGKKTKKETLKIALKLAIILGITEGLGFIQIAKSHLSYSEEVFNACFSLLYSTFRGLRGLMLCSVYIIGANVLGLYRKRARSLFTTDTGRNWNVLYRHKGMSTSSSQHDQSETNTSTV
ncbi:uncharacterized protein LOC130630669 [Hydractinia symbiolongicarpus]|uniref:uncharacterized protein LOC130630669 n=1 Tax=Hydractinia symbiolongicarpus TaxID=13093 RepID=UPI00254FCF3B|nr:uncharacterized protein LOC130630669 [Hydractinia symbiolongicarpus]